MSSLAWSAVQRAVDGVPAVVLVPVAVALVLVIFTKVYYMLSRGLSYDSRLFDLIPGKRPLPLLGNALDVAVTPPRFLRALSDLCSVSDSGVTRLYLAHRPYVVLTKADAVEVVLSSQKHISKGPDYRFIHPWLGLGLLTADGERWKARRKMITPAFHFNILEDFLQVMNEQSEFMVEKLTSVSLDNSGHTNIFPYVTYCALDIICESAMGRSVDAQRSNVESQYVRSVFKASDLIFKRQIAPWLWGELAWWLHPSSRQLKSCLSTLHAFTDKVIAERKVLVKERLEHGHEEDEGVDKKKRRLAFLDLLIEASDEGRVLTDEDIRQEVDTFMFEGHDTTAANMTFTLYLLAAHPEVQRKVQCELDAILGDDPRRPFTMDDLTKMKYLESCIKESLRLFPSVPMVTRTLHESVKIKDYVVPAETNVLVFFYELHRDPSVFPNPEAFDPDRFDSQAAATGRVRHPYAYVPFSAGPRNCIGQRFALMEEKVVIASVLRSFDISTDLKQDQLQLLPELILRPVGGIPVAFKLRN